MRKPNWCMEKQGLGAVGSRIGSSGSFCSSCGGVRAGSTVGVEVGNVDIEYWSGSSAMGV